MSLARISISCLTLLSAYHGHAVPIPCMPSGAMKIVSVVISAFLIFHFVLLPNYASCYIHPHPPFHSCGSAHGHTVQIQGRRVFKSYQSFLPVRKPILHEHQTKVLNRGSIWQKNVHLASTAAFSQNTLSTDASYRSHLYLFPSLLIMQLLLCFNVIDWMCVLHLTWYQQASSLGRKKFCFRFRIYATPSSYKYGQVLYNINVHRMADRSEFLRCGATRQPLHVTCAPLFCLIGV